MGPDLPDDIRRYLIQTRELYGDDLYLDLNKPSPPNATDSKLPNNIPTGIELDAYHRQIQSCQRCQLGQTRNKFVFGVGDPHASLMLVGEAPGADEDRLGEPFVGRAGNLLDKILAAINRDRQHDVFICNVLKCRPPNNRDPQVNELDQCEPYLIHQIHLIKPKLIVALGRVAGKKLLNVDKPLKTMRNFQHEYYGIPLIVTYHPAALLRNPNWKPEAWKDFKWIRSILDGQ